MKAPDLDELPGHYIRRLHQIAVAIFLQETEAHGLTPVQYGALSQVGLRPGGDQRTRARSLGLDTSSTVAGAIDRLETRGLMRRKASPEDRRVRLLSLTVEGQNLLPAVEPDMLKAQRRILQPLPAAKRVEFMCMLHKLVTANNGLSRAPSEA